MIEPSSVEERLSAAIRSSDPTAELERVVDELRESGAALSAVAPILRFLESHPDVDFGSPGPLVHFVERFYRAGYEEELLSSIGRRPTAHTVWMLNRILNGTKDINERGEMLDALRLAANHAEADDEAKTRAAHFLARAVAELRMNAARKQELAAMTRAHGKHQAPIPWRDRRLLNAVVIGTTLYGGVRSATSSAPKSTVSSAPKTATPRAPTAARAAAEPPARGSTGVAEGTAEQATTQTGNGPKPPCTCNTCFVAGTVVLTPSGEVAIEDLAPGDRVVSRDVATGEDRVQEISEVFMTEGREIIALVVKDGGGREDLLDVTGNHPFWVFGKGWKAASDLALGETLRAPADTSVLVVSLATIPRVATVYNIEVVGTHTYFAGHVRALVHNPCPFGEYDGSKISHGRVKLTKGEKASVEAKADKAPDGKFLDANTGQPIEGKHDFGHKPGKEFRTSKAEAIRKSSSADHVTQEQWNREQHNTDNYQIEDPSNNRSHQFEQK